MKNGNQTHNLTKLRKHRNPIRDHQFLNQDPNYYLTIVGLEIRVNLRIINKNLKNHRMI